MVDEMTHRLRQAVSNGGGNKVVAEKAEVPLSTLNNYLAGRDMKGQAAAKIAAACGISLDWLFFGYDPKTGIDSFPNVDRARLPFYDVEACAGAGHDIAETPSPIEYEVSTRLLDLLSLPAANAIMIRIDGDSMEPILRSSDLVLLDTKPSKKMRGKAVVVFDDQLLVKRLEPIPGGKVSLISDNPLYPSREIDADALRWGQPEGGDTVSIIGRVVYRLQAL